MALRETKRIRHDMHHSPTPGQNLQPLYYEGIELTGLQDIKPLNHALDMKYMDMGMYGHHMHSPIHGGDFGHMPMYAMTEQYSR